MQEPIMSVSGIRGIVGRSLTPENASRFATAFASELPPGPIVLSYDGRVTGPLLARSIAAALEAVGRDVHFAGVAATPTTGILVASRQGAGGIQISASHNPPEYNGLKLFGSNGRVLTAEAGERVIERYRDGSADWVGYDRIGSYQAIEQPQQTHLERVLAAVDVEAIRAKRFRVLLDANHGSGSCLGGPLLAALGCEVRILGGTPDGRFAHPPEPTPANLETVLAEVPAWGAELGFCQDPDADRLAIIDNSGRYLGEEFTLAICVAEQLRTAPGPVVTNCSTSQMCQLLAQQRNVPFARSKVGEAHVVDVMLQTGAVLGGEGNGGVIAPLVGLVRDSFIGMARVLAAMAARDLPVAALAEELPQLAMAKSKVPSAGVPVSDLLAALQRHWSDASADHQDGLRLDWPGRWLLVRPSNTEPIVRIMTEAENADAAEQLAAEATEVMMSVAS